MNGVRPLLWPLLACVLLAPQFLRAQSTNTVAWSIAVLDGILTNVPPGQKTVHIDDMEILVTNLRAWRGKLAGDPQPKIAFDGASATWPGGNVYYTFDDSVTPDKQQAVLDGAAEWATFANLHFIPRTIEANYIVFRQNDSLGGGQSAVGMIGGPQITEFGPYAWNRPTICHEIGHALGLVHEHQRSDRDSFVTIITTNINPYDMGNFSILTDSRNKSPYDFLSIMHYSRNSLAIDSAYDTIEPLPAYQQYVDLMGVRFDPPLTASDRAGMASIYGAVPSPATVVTNSRDSGPGSLRAALYTALDYPGTTITFNIPPTDPGFSNNVFNITLSDVLPSVLNNTVIDATTQPNNTPGNRNVLLTSASPPVPGTFPFGLRFHGTNSAVKGLTIASLPGAGIIVEKGASTNLIGGPLANDGNVISSNGQQGIVCFDTNSIGNIVRGNLIGLTATGDAAMANVWEGVGLYNGPHGNLIISNVISGNGNAGVRLDKVFNNTVQGNWIGLNAAGTAAVPNGWHGVGIYNGSTSNLIGGPLPAQRNVISGNSQQGLAMIDAGTSGNIIQGNYIGLSPAGTSTISNNWEGLTVYDGPANNFVLQNVVSGNGGTGITIFGIGTDGNVVQGNLLGLDPTGTSALGNGYAGLSIFNGATGNLIGGQTSAARNVISGNSAYGLTIDGAGSSSNVVHGNFIGLNTAGNAAVPNAWAGMAIFNEATTNIIGGNLPGQRNVVSGNSIQGIIVVGAGTSGNVISGNYVGLNAAGTAAIPNQWIGINLFGGPQGNMVGGTKIGAGNIVGGNLSLGIVFQDPGTSNNAALGNFVGLNPVGSGAFPNATGGIGLWNGAVGNQIGGVNPGEANVIANNLADAVQLFDPATTNNTIRGNSSFGNLGSGLALYTGANQLSPAPSLVSAVTATNTMISGNLTGGAANATLQIDFYSSPAAPSQGLVYLGDAIATTDNGGAATVNVGLPARIPAGRIVTATATDPSGNTSAMSAGTAVTASSTVNDSIPDAWRALYFGGDGTATNGQSCATCDADGDGLNNFQEFLAGTNPTNSASNLRLFATRPNSSNTVAGFLSAPGAVYQLQTRDDLSTGFWTIAVDQIAGGGTNIFLTDPAPPAAKRFYRLQLLW